MQQAESGDWEAIPLRDGMVPGRGRATEHHLLRHDSTPDAAMEAVRAEVDGRGRWLLLTPPSRRLIVNGRIIPGGIRVLRDRDEVVCAGARFYFSSEELAIVAPLPADAAVAPGHEVRCARCKQPIRAGTPAVKCPFCNAWHHQDEAGQRPCWTYSATCAGCAQATEFKGAYQWSPAGL